jgi:protein-tyrosine phosphatase
MRVAMVCLGNICRSPMAAMVARTLVAEHGLADRVEVVSFGTVGHHLGEGIDARAREALVRRGWALQDHSARRLTAADIGEVDLVLCADHANLAAVRQLDPDAPESKIRLLRSFDASSPSGAEVPDPWGGDPEVFDEALVLIEAACRGLVAQLASSPG